ncbi:MAG: hypothetical protein JRF33_17275 [Deltaproteobacteria bacterium]|nr:hypothetical protein [Deltaproteobacteria bacterium]
MKFKARKPWFRLAITLAVVIGGFACGDTGCDCVTPLEEPMAEEHKLYDSVQARLTPHALTFIEDNLVPIMETFLGPGGLSFDIPRVSDGVEILFLTYNYTICQNGCTITAEILSTDITPRAPNYLDLHAVVNITGSIDIEGSLAFECTVPLHAINKDIDVTISLPIDSRDNLMTFDVESIDFEITTEDYSFDDCNIWVLPVDWLFEWLQDLLTDTLNSQIQDQLDGTLDEMLYQSKCLPDDFYSGGCPSGSNPVEGFCVGAGGCRIKPLGMVGTLDVGELTTDVMPGMSAQLDLFVAAGQEESVNARPLVVAGGVEMRMIGGADSEQDSCVPTPSPLEVPSNDAPPPLIYPVGDVMPDSGQSYMAAIGIADAFLDWSLYKAYLSGLVCLEIGSDLTDLLNSGTLSALLGSINHLTGGLNTPVKLVIKPLHVPYAEVGAGTFTAEGELDEPLIWIFMPGLAMDFYIMVDERYVRALTLTQDVTLSLSLQFNPDNTVTPLFGEDSILIDNVVATNYELLAEDPAALESLVPTLIGIAMPMLTDALQPIAIPPIEGFELNIIEMAGHMPRAAEPQYHEYLGMFANLCMEGQCAIRSRDTQVSLQELRVPSLGQMSIFAPDGPTRPELVLRVAADEGPEAEFSFRIDGGNWRLFKRGPELIVRDPLLSLTGRHVIEVRARSVGDYRSLDPSPARIDLDIQPRDDGLSYEPDYSPSQEALDRLLGPDADHARLTNQLEADEGVDEADEDDAHLGCSTTGGLPGAGILLALLGLALIRRRY